MKRNFGFEPYEGGGKYGFISYKSEEYLIVAKYAKALSDKGMNLWYDYGIPPGEWEATISEKIVGASFIILFVSAKIFDSHFIKTEIKTAWKWKIPIIPVFMEDIPTSQIPPKDATFFTQIDALQGVRDAQNMSVEQVANEMHRLVKPKIASDKDSAISTRRANYERERRERPNPVQPKPEPELVKQTHPEPVKQETSETVHSNPTQQSTTSFQKQEGNTPVFRDTERQNSSYSKPKNTTPVFRDTERRNPTPKLTQKENVMPRPIDPKQIVAAVSLVLVVAVVIAFVVHSLTNSITDYLIDIKSVEDITSIDEISVGQHLKFGAYEQDENIFTGKETIEWRVLAVRDGKALLITEKLLDYVPYNKEYESITWKTCTLRKWMNEDFINTAFTASEQNKIALTTLNNSGNFYYGTEGGVVTKDKIFALSIDEAEKYFSSDSDRKAYVTEYAKAKGYCYDDGSDDWWLRSPGDNSVDAAFVSEGGGINSYGYLVEHGNVAVRPAMWVQF